MRVLNGAIGAVVFLAMIANIGVGADDAVEEGPEEVRATLLDRALAGEPYTVVDWNLARSDPDYEVTIGTPTEDGRCLNGGLVQGRIVLSPKDISMPTGVGVQAVATWGLNETDKPCTYNVDARLYRGVDALLYFATTGGGFPEAPPEGPCPNPFVCPPFVGDGGSGGDPSTDFLPTLCRDADAWTYSGYPALVYTRAYAFMKFCWDPPSSAGTNEHCHPIPPNSVNDWSTDYCLTSAGHPDCGSVHWYAEGGFSKNTMYHQFGACIMGGTGGVFACGHMYDSGQQWEGGQPTGEPWGGCNAGTPYQY